MLVVTRKIGEQILIGDDIVVQIVDVGHGKVRVGITAPREVRILREELITKKGVDHAEAENKSGK